MSEERGLPGHTDHHQDLVLVWILARSSGAAARETVCVCFKDFGSARFTVADIFSVMHVVQSGCGWV
jgi:hypothetical protein